ncbi:MAG: FtsX-like permease family protein [Sulfolobales archaeon]
MGSAITRLSGFSYLRRRYILTLVLVLTIASALFSTTAFILLGIYETLEAQLGGGSNIMIIYNPGSRTPYTSSVPAHLAIRLSEIGGVLASSPEVITPCIVNGRSVFMRGAIPEDLGKIDGLTIIDGDRIGLSDIDSALIGRNAAERLGLRVGDTVLVFSILSDRYVELRIRGIFISGSALDDEIVAPLYVAQWLSGLDYGSVTLIRLKLSPSANISEVLSIVRAELPKPTQPEPGELTPLELLVLWSAGRSGQVSAEEASRFVESYVGRYGVTREALLTASISTLVFSSLAIVLASRTLVAQHRGELGVLRSLGASKKLLKIDLLIKLLPWIIISSILGILIASAYLAIIQSYGFLQIFSHTVKLEIDPLIIILSIASSTTLTTLGILGCELQ